MDRGRWGLDDEPWAMDRNGRLGEGAGQFSRDSKIEFKVAG
jgi:hypothetical protein